MLSKTNHRHLYEEGIIEYLFYRIKLHVGHSPPFVTLAIPVDQIIWVNRAANIFKLPAAQALFAQITEVGLNSPLAKKTECLFCVIRFAGSHYLYLHASPLLARLICSAKKI